MEGTLKWAKVYDPDEFRGATRWTVNFYPNDEGMKIFDKSGLQLTKKSDDDGTYVSLRRPTDKLIKKELVIFTPPFIYGKDGEELVTYKGKDKKNVYSYEKGSRDDVVRDGSPINIGNGSVARVRVAVYDTAMGKGHRLESIRLIDLIEYVPNDQVEDEEVDETPSYQPAKAAAAKATKVAEAKTTEVEDDAGVPW